MPRTPQQLVAVTADPLEVLTWMDGPEVPDPITFAIGEDWLDRPNLYPRQATLLKIIFLRDDLFSDFDHMVIAEWIGLFNTTNSDDSGENKFSARTKGIQPDIYERITYLKERGYRWFHELILALGRRGSKGYVCALAMAYIIWNYIALGNPQEHYGIDRDKTLAAMIFAGKRDQAKENLFGDVFNVVTGAPCFTAYISEARAEMLSLYAPYDFVRMRRLAARGIMSTRDAASIQVVPRESTLLAARGPAGFCIGFDEAAHVVNAGVSRSFGDVYNSATPSLDQFGKDGFICLPSSTWQMIGRFYELWELSLSTEDIGGGPVPLYPNKLMLQLESWAIYQDWERAHLLPLFPPGFEGDLGEYAGRDLPVLQPLKKAIQAFDEELAKEEMANPETFSVERRSDWATVLDAYLNSQKVAEIFRPWPGRPAHYGPPELQMQSSGPLVVSYKAHGDPSTVNARFGFSMAHEEADDNGMLHVVFDLVHYWDPADFPGHTIDYDEVTDWIYDNVVCKFCPEELTFDQFNSTAAIQRLQKMIRAGRLPKNVQVFEKTATAPLNWRRFETFKAAINMGFVHSPPHAEAQQELSFLQLMPGGKVDHPTSGPVQNKDIADTMVEVVHVLLGEQMNNFIARDLRSARPGMGLPGGVDAYSRFDPGRDSNPYAGALGSGNPGAGLARGLHPGGLRQPGRINPAAARRHRS